MSVITGYYQYLAFLKLETVDLNQVVLSPTQLPPIGSVIDSVIDSVTYSLFPLPPPSPLLVLISYTFLMYI